MKIQSTPTHRNNYRIRFATVFLLSAFLLLFPPSLFSADLIHQYDFDGNLNDTVGSGDPLTIYPNTATNGFGDSEWWWTATTTPGGGLIINTDIADPQTYSLGFRIEFNQVGPSWKKIISFKGPSDDNGLYFYGSHLQFYPFGSNTEITYSADTFYDFIFVRSSDDIIRVYVVEGDGTVTNVYERDDSGDDAVPLFVTGKYQFMLFMDDITTTSEWTDGGTVKSIRVWNGTLAEEEISDALSDISTGSATDITSNSATLNGTINPKNIEATVGFEYGETDSYGSQVTADQSPVNGSVNQDVSASITNLLPATLYHFRIVATNSNGTSYGSDRTFTTTNVPSAPTVTTQAVTNISTITATGNGNITDLGSPNPTVHGVCWNTTGNSTTGAADSHTDEGAADATGAFTSNMTTGLVASTLYYVRAYATNSAGTSYGNEVTFTTNSDGTGVPPGTQDAGPNGGDGNGDGTLDSTQTTVASLPAATGGGYITVSSTSPCNQLEQVAAYTYESVGVNDPGHSYPFGLVGFRFSCSPVTVKIYYHGGESLEGYIYRKYGPTPADWGVSRWYTMTGVTFGTELIGGETVPYAQFVLTDGLIGDDTGVDQIIIDQGGPAAPGSAIPTLSEWGMIILFLLMLTAGFMVIRRRRV